MRLTMLDIVMMLLGVVALAAWLALYFKGKKNAALFAPLNEKDFMLKEIYFVGYALTEVLNCQYKSAKDRKLRKNLEIMYGPKYAEYYLRVIYAQKFTMGATLFVFSFALYGLADSILAFFVGLMFAFAAYYYFETETEKKLLKRSEEMLRDFSEVISKLALLTNAGMILREAWQEVAVTGDSSIYQEMQKTVDEMNNGYSEIDAFFNFGTRCIIPEIKKFSSTIIQGLVKGNSELTLMLMEQSKEVWAAKKQHVRRQGEKAASKLMIPICMMFVGILVMILIPIFTNLGM